MGKKKFILAGFVALVAFLFANHFSRADVTVTFDPQTRFQTIRAWESTIEVFWTPDYEPFRAEIYDRIIGEVGITRLRLETFSGAENIDHSFDQFRTGAIDMDGWRARRYATVNDDADPFHINWAGFDFANLDWRIEQHLLPILERAKVHNQKIDIDFTYVAFTKQIRNGSYIHTDPEEYAEFTLAAFLHMRDKYGIVPGSFEPLLEPDNNIEWTPHKLGLAIAAATRRLNHAGFHPRVIVPSVSDIHQVLPWLDGIAAVPGAMDNVAEISYHRYHGGDPVLLKAIAARALKDGLETSMLEYWGGKATYLTLHDDLKLANVSSWQGRTVLKHHSIDLSRPVGQQLVLNDDVRYNRLYFTAIRPGCTRIAAKSTAPQEVNPLAFVYPDGTMAVVMRTEKAAAAHIKGLPEGDYWLETAFEGGGTADKVFFHVGPDHAFTASIPARGVIAIRPAKS